MEQETKVDFQKKMEAEITEIMICIWVEVKKITGMDFVVWFERNVWKGKRW